MSSCTTSRDLPRMSVSVTNWIISLTLWLLTYKISPYTTSRNLPSNVWWLHKWQTELSPLHCDFLHIKFLLVLHLETCQAMSDDYRWETELSPLPCHFLHIKYLLVLHLENCQAMSDDCISDKLNYLPYLVTSNVWLYSDKISYIVTFYI